jgi:hypothetical protein
VDYETIKRVLSALEREGVRYIVFGAAALNFHGLARFTEDLDLFIAPDRDNVDRLKRALRSVFDDHHIDEISADDLAGDYPALQYVPPEGTFHIDMLARHGVQVRRPGSATDAVRRRHDLCGHTPNAVSYEARHRSPEGQSRRGTAPATIQSEG